ncbi:MAG: phosphoribosylanthranilate isomerase [Planctomycetota bacterium]
MFRVKICGVTSVEEAQAAAAAGADAIGLNFFAGSKRYLCRSMSNAEAVAAAVPTGVLRIGVFVNANAAEIHETAQRFRIAAIQLHGNESPALPTELLALLPGTPVLRACRVGVDGLSTVVAELEACTAAGRAPDAVLLDAPAGKAFGGAGTSFDWRSVEGHAEALGGLPVILAGGLTPSNVAQAIGTVAPHGVDVASGVEEASGKKSAAEMRQFVAAARSALA